MITLPTLTFSMTTPAAVCFALSGVCTAIGLVFRRHGR
jgi:hypothetical protein